MSIFKFLRNFDQALTRIEENLLLALLGLMLLVVFIGVINRFMINLSMSWSEELARYLMIWTAFIGASLGVKYATHITVDSFVSIFPNKARAHISFIMNIACCIFCIWIAHIGYIFLEKLMMTGQISPALRVPIYYAYTAVPLGFLMMGLRYLLNLIIHLEPILIKINNNH